MVKSIFTPIAIGVIFLFILTNINAQTVQEVRIVGCKKTKTDHLGRFLCVHPGEQLDSTRLKRDEQVLRNLDLFSTIIPTVRDTTDGCIIEYHLKERTTRIPIGNVGAAGGTIIAQVGIIDYNFMGNGSVASAYYRYYDRHTFHAFIRTPYIKKSRWGYSVNLLKQSTLEPVKFPEQDLRYLYDLYSAEFLARYEFKFNNFLEFGINPLYEKYSPQILEDVVSPRAISVDTPKFLAKVLHTFNRVNFFNEYRDGFSNFACFEVSTAPEVDDNAFWKFQNSTSYFRRIRKRGNLALRLNIGVSDNDYTPFPSFVLDNYINVRGAGDRVLRGSRELSFNAEYRQMVFERKIGAIQLVPFLDFGALALSGEDFDTIWRHENQALFGGMGLRVSIRQFSNMILRLDLSADLRNEGEYGFGFGLGQYF